MQDTNSIPDLDLSRKPETPQNIPQEITLETIITAPEDQWRELCAIIDASPDFCERMRARRRLQESGQMKSKPKRAHCRSRASTSTRNWSAASVLHSQQIGAAMLETVDRVNSGKLDGDGESRSILVAAGDEFQVMEVVA